MSQGNRLKGKPGPRSGVPPRNNAERALDGLLKRWHRGRVGQGERRGPSRSQSWLDDPGIVALGVGRKVTGGCRKPRLSLRVFVVRKVKRRDPSLRIPEFVKLTGVDALIPTDVEEVGTPSLHGVTAGRSFSGVYMATGTLGPVVRPRKGNGSLAVLASTHVVANATFGTRGMNVLQPGRMDGGTYPEGRIGKVSALPGLSKDSSASFRHEACLVEVEPGLPVDAKIPVLGIPTGVSMNPKRGLTVRKYGRSTQLTEGEVDDYPVHLLLTYRDGIGGRPKLLFKNQVSATYKCREGDSGAPVLDDAGRLMGMHIGMLGAAGIFSPIGPIFEHFDVEAVIA